MQEYLVFIWNFEGRGGARAALAMLGRCDLRHEAKQGLNVPMDDPDTDKPWKTGSLGSVRLRKADPRVAALRRELRAAGVEPLERVDRVHTKEDLEVEWLSVEGSTTMVLAGNAKGQRWDFKRACGECGAGAVPVPPLIVRFEGKPPKQGWSVSVPCGLVVVSAALAGALEEAGLTGFTAEPARTPSKSEIDGRFRWLRIPCAWPAPVPQGKRRACAECGRVRVIGEGGGSGVRFAHAPTAAKDFNAWQGFVLPEERVASVVNRPTGDLPNIIISRRAYEVLRNAGVKSLKCEPVEIG